MGRQAQPEVAGRAMSLASILERRAWQQQRTSFSVPRATSSRRRASSVAGSGSSRTLLFRPIGTRKLPRGWRLVEVWVARSGKRRLALNSSVKKSSGSDGGRYGGVARNQSEAALPEAPAWQHAPFLSFFFPSFDPGVSNLTQTGGRPERWRGDASVGMSRDGAGSGAASQEAWEAAAPARGGG